MKTFNHKFVDFIPDKKEPGVLYISVPYKSAAHSCFCGCGNVVYTPLIEERWSLIFQAGKVSLYPSIGSWNLDCKSHYFLTKNEVEWLKPFSDSDDLFASDNYHYSIFDWLSRHWAKRPKRKRKNNY